MNPLWNQRAVDGLFQNLAAGSFRPAGLQEIATFFGLLALIGLALWWSSRVVSDRLQRRRREHSRNLTSNAVEQLGLAPSDARLAAALAETLEAPLHEGHTVLTKEVVFRATRRSLVAQKPLAAHALTAFRARLGFPARGAGLILDTSAEIPAGALLHCIDQPTSLQVVRVESAGFWVEARGTMPAQGREFVAALHRSEGYYLLTTTVLQDRAGVFLLQHCPNLIRRQRRQDFRYSIRVPVSIDRRPTETMNLSAGGVCLRGPVSVYEEGDTVQLRFPSLLSDDTSIQARVVTSDAAVVRLVFAEGQTGRCDTLLRNCIRAVRERDLELARDAPAVCLTTGSGDSR